VPSPAKPTPDPRDLVDDGSSAATAYRVIAGRIVYGDPEEVIHSLTVVDTESETGSAVVAINLGRALAHLGRRVVVIDGGTRSGLAGLYGVEPVPGIRDVLRREVQPRTAMRVIGERLALIPTGYEGTELVDPERARAVAHELLASADVVIVAAPPVDAGPGALSWTRALDRTVFVARRDHARREDVEAAAETLVQAGGNLVGAILAERRAPLAGLLGRGRSGPSRAVAARPASSPALVPPMASPMAAVATAPPVAPLQPSSPPTSQQPPPFLRPTIIRASAPALLVTPEPGSPPPADPSRDAPGAAPSRASTSRSTSARSRSSRPTGPRNDPTINP
jgi:Mrp family chromosome partitioning ATPase